MSTSARVSVAMLTVAGCLVWMLVILAGDVRISAPDGEVDHCGSAKSVLSGDFAYGGEQVWPDDYESLCREAARGRLVWLVVPVVAGGMAALHLYAARRRGAPAAGGRQAASPRTG